MTKKNSNNIKFSIAAIELLDSCLNYTENPLPNNTFQFEINIEHRLNIEKKVVIVVCDATIVSEDKKNVLGRLRTSCVYNIDEFDGFINKETNKLHFPDDFITTMNSISISTTRGMMFSFFRGTVLHNAVLPIINPSDYKLTS